jgi:hypothetical protein
LLKIYHFADEMMGQEKLRRFNARMKKFPNPDYILQIKEVGLVSKNEMCAHNYDILLYLERHTQSLASILAARLKDKKNFSEKEIYTFINKVLEALIFVQDNGFRNCHLDKNSIVFCRETVKLMDLAIATSYPYQALLDKLEPSPGFYVAPEHLRDLKDRNYEPYLSPKSDIFCLGMLVLELACMEPLDSYYNYRTFTLDYESLIHRVSKIVYSVELKILIAGMLEFEPDLRTGLVTSQEKVKRILNIEGGEQDNGRHRRSRSSSTKMLKELLTSSRKTLTTPATDNNSMARKPSQASFISIASANVKHSASKSHIPDNHPKKQNDLLLSCFETNTLKNLVRNKIEGKPSQEPKPSANKENLNTSHNKVPTFARL